MMKEQKGMRQDNKMVKDDHQQGIERVKMRPGDLMKGQGGKMGEPKSDKFRRGGTMTPRQG